MSLPDIAYDGLDLINDPGFTAMAADPARARRAAHLGSSSSSSNEDAASSNTPAMDEYNTPTIKLLDIAQGGRLSLPRISLESYLLGVLLGLGIVMGPHLILAAPSRLWRVPVFLATLSVFHFLEFYTYARWNIKNTKADSFLTFWNGRAYPIAMSVGLLEALLTSYFFARWQSFVSALPVQVIGIVLVLLGQYMRHAAIATAGSSFNHIVQQHKRDDHVLVTWGPYAWCRHPSYFGFYWWAVGSQLLIGNAVSTVLFAVILWRFFWRRIPGEETALIEMFGDEYKQFRASRSIGIPFMASAVDKALIRIARRKQQTRDAGSQARQSARDSAQ